VAGLVHPLTVRHVDQADPKRDGSPYRLRDVAHRLSVAAQSCRDRLMVAWLITVVAGRQAHTRQAEHVPQSTRHVHQIREYLHGQPAFHGVLNESGETGVQSWLTANELHHSDPQ